MAEQIKKTLEAKGIKVPPHHEKPLLNQWNLYLKMKSNPELAKFNVQDIGLVHIPGGERNE